MPIAYWNWVISAKFRMAAVVLWPTDRGDCLMHSAPHGRTHASVDCCFNRQTRVCVARWASIVRLLLDELTCDFVRAVVKLSSALSNLIQMCLSLSPCVCMYMFVRSWVCVWVCTNLDVLFCNPRIYIHICIYFSVAIWQFQSIILYVLSSVLMQRRGVSFVLLLTRARANMMVTVPLHSL